MRRISNLYRFIAKFHNSRLKCRGDIFVKSSSIPGNSVIRENGLKDKGMNSRQ